MAKTDYKYYVIMNKRTKRLVSGTNYDRNGKPVQIYADEYHAPFILPEGSQELHTVMRNLNLNTFCFVRVDILLREANK